MNDSVKKGFYINTDEKSAWQAFYKQLEQQLSALISPEMSIIILCIGSDKATGDSFGPLIGYKLINTAKKYGFKVYGTLDNPVHAKNLIKIIQDIYCENTNPFIIAIDSCLGNANIIGHLSLGKGTIKPGLASGKNLPEVGDMFITGIVNESHSLNPLVLHSTRLSLVMKMADIVTYGLKKSLKKIRYSEAFAETAASETD